MARKYRKVEHLAGAVFERKERGETNREIAQSYGLTLAEVKGLVKRQNRKKRMQAAGYVPRPKGRPRTTALNPEEMQQRELAQLRMENDLLRNFLSEVGRR